MLPSTLLAHKGVRWVALGWSGFLAENVVMTHNRTTLISAFGETTYYRVYAGLSTLASSSILYGYVRSRGQGPRMPIVLGASPLGRVAAFSLQALGLIGFSQALPRMQVPFVAGPASAPAAENAARGLQEASRAAIATDIPAGQSLSFQVRCPFDFRGDSMPPNTIHNVERVTRHPQLWSLAALGAGAALRAQVVAEAIFFGFPTIFALVGGAHQDYRYRRGSGGALSPEKDAVTSHVPFVALVTGRQSWTALFDEIKGLNATTAIAIALLLARRAR